jgi:hypothetical protein
MTAFLINSTIFIVILGTVGFIAAHRERRAREARERATPRQ